jgi:superfamily II DNA or RNA helicase
MDQIAHIRILDEVNVHITGVDVRTRSKLIKAVEFFLPSAKYSFLYKSGRWNGCIAFCTQGGRTYINVLDRLLPILQDAGYEIEIDDQRAHHKFEFVPIDENYNADTTWPSGHRFAGEPIVLRDYQVDAINDCLMNLQGVNVLATGSGKTLITATLSKLVEPYGRSVVIVPNKSLVTQTEADYRNLGLDVGVMYGDRKEYDRTHTICTWQSLNVLDKKHKDALDAEQMAVFMKDLICVIVDECHSVRDMSIVQKLLTNNFKNVPIRWGLTGTLPEEEWNQLSLFCSIGPQIGELAAHELQEAGVLASCNVQILQTQETAQYTQYQEELKYLTTDQSRLKWLSDQITHISTTGNTLVLVDRIATGEFLRDEITGSIFISGDMKNHDRAEYYREMELVDNRVVVATYGVAAVGISINRINHVVLVEPGKSFIRVVQSIGRGLRKSNTKDHVTIWDIASKCRFSNNHLNKRKQIYSKVQYPYEVKKVTY